MTGKPEIVVYGNDYGPRAIVENIARSAEGAFDVVRFAADVNRPVADEEIEQSRHAVGVLLGLSTGRPEADVLARMRRAGFRGRVGFFEDFSRMGTAYASGPMREAAAGSVLFVIQPGDEQAIQDFGYADAVVSGIPDHWHDQIRDIETGKQWRDEPDRIRLVEYGRGEERLLEETDRLVFVSGMIEPRREQLAIDRLTRDCGASVRVVFRPHPGERNMEDLEKDIVRRDREIAGKAWTVANDDVVNAGRRAASYLIGIGRDASVLHPGSQPVLLAPTQKLNIVTASAFVSKKLRETGFPYDAVADANTLLVRRIADVSGAVEELLRPDSPVVQELRRKQHRHAAPMPRADEPASKIIVRTFARLLGLDA